VARRYGVWPGAIDTHNPEHVRWLRRAWAFAPLEAERDYEREKYLRGQAARRRMRGSV